MFYIKDPMTDEWDPLDAELLGHLSTRKWTSMAIERYLKSPTFQQKLDMGPVKYKFALDYMNGSDESGDLNQRRGEANVFEAGMPGVMTITEIQETMNLGHWRLMIGDRIVLLEVGTHLLFIPNCPTNINLCRTWPAGTKATYQSQALSSTWLQSLLRVSDLSWLRRQY